MSNRIEAAPRPPELSDNARWYCIVTNQNEHRRVELELYGQGYRTFMPKVRKWTSHARVKTAVERPLLGRYLFVEVDYPRQSFGFIKSMRGVQDILRNDGRPLPIPQKWIDDLRTRYMQGEWDFVREEPVIYGVRGPGDVMEQVVRHNQKSPIGARIRIMEGEFKDLIATITARKGSMVTFKLAGTNQYGKVVGHQVRAA